LSLDFRFPLLVSLGLFLQIVKHSSSGAGGRPSGRRPSRLCPCWATRPAFTAAGLSPARRGSWAGVTRLPRAASSNGVQEANPRRPGRLACTLRGRLRASGARAQRWPWFSREGDRGGSISIASSCLIPLSSCLFNCLNT